MVQRISEAECVSENSALVTWRVRLSEPPSGQWRRCFLARAHRIFDAVGANIWLGGTTLLFELERPSLRIGLEQIDAWIDQSDDDEATQAQTILLVAESDVARGFARHILEEQGYAVIDTDDPWQAVEVAGGCQVDLLVADVSMARMGGPELAARIQALSPATRALFMCADTRDAQIAGAAPVIVRHFTVPDLVHRVRQALCVRSPRPQRTHASFP